MLNELYSLTPSSRFFSIKKGFRRIIIRYERSDKIFRTTRNLIDTSRKDKNQKAEKIGIILLFLPIYSPDLNPLERIWRCVKKSVSKGFIKSEEYLK